jgi:hypothetical protein
MSEDRDVFSNNSVLMGTADLIPDNNNGVELVSAAFRDGIPRQVTVVVAGTIALTTIKGYGSREIFARVQIGVGGTPFDAEVDLIQGTVFSVACSSIRVVGVFKAITGATPTPTPAPATIGAAVALGSMSGGFPPQRTIADDTVRNAGVRTPSYTIPPFAKRFKFEATMINGGPPGGTWQIGVGGTGTSNAWTSVVSKSPSQWIEIPNDANFVVATNMDVPGPGGTQYSGVRFIFELAL